MSETEKYARILLLSYNPAQMDMIARQAADKGFECVTMSDINEALDLLETQPFDVMVVDEDLQGVSGVDVLIQAREIEPYTTFILVVDEDLAIGVAADALNQADVTRILLAPYELEEWVECCQDAYDRYHRNTRTQRHLNLSQAKVRRLRRTVEQSKRDLRKKSRQIEQMRKAPVVPPAQHRPPQNEAPQSQAPQSDPEQDQKLYIKVSTLMTRVLMAGPQGPQIRRLRNLVEYCGRKLQWPASEVRLVSEAALYHHALLPEYPGESRNELRSADTKHADEMDKLLLDLPGFSEIARLVGEHHGRRLLTENPAQPIAVSRGAKLLQALSLFDELAYDPELLASEHSNNDPEFALNRASETVLRLALEEKLDPELTALCIKELIPRALERDETCLSASELEPGMQLSRALYTDNLILIRALETLSETTLEQIRYADETQKFAGIWVVGEISPTLAKGA